MSTEFRPMLAAPAAFDKLRWPMYGSPKLDGVRATVRSSKLLSRSLKLIPNTDISIALSKAAYEGLDGELIVGEPNSPTCYRDTVSGVMSQDKVVDWTFYAFDWYLHDRPFEDRFDVLYRNVLGKHRIQVLPQKMLTSAQELDVFEVEMLALGYEGVMLRDPRSLYKFGRSTASEGYLLKVKRFVDGEARVLEVIEEMHNGNVAETNELGRTKRSSHQENKTGKGRMGALLVEDMETGVEFQVGTGFDDSDRALWWAFGAREQIIKYKHFPIGIKDKPRHPVYLGLRDARDMV